MSLVGGEEGLLPVGFNFCAGVIGVEGGGDAVGGSVDDEAFA